MKKNSVKGMR